MNRWLVGGLACWILVGGVEANLEAATRERSDGARVTIPDSWEFEPDPESLHFSYRDQPDHIHGRLSVMGNVYESARQAAEESRQIRLGEGRQCEEIASTRLGVSGLEAYSYWCFSTHPVSGRELATIAFYAMLPEDADIALTITGPRDQLTTGSWLLQHIEYIKDNLRF